jgi:hypothetical protein
MTKEAFRIHGAANEPLGDSSALPPSQLDHEAVPRACPIRESTYFVSFRIGLLMPVISHARLLLLTGAFVWEPDAKLGAKALAS